MARRYHEIGQEAKAPQLQPVIRATQWGGWHSTKKGYCLVTPLRGLGAFYHSRGPAKQSWLTPYLLGTCQPRPSDLSSSAQPVVSQPGSSTVLPVAILASTQVMQGSEVTTVPPHQALHRPCQQA